MSDPLHVMTFNVRGPENPAPNSWAEREPIVAELVRREHPHVLGTQEGRYHQIRALARELRSDYDWIGIGREGGSASEFGAVFYDVGRLEPLEFDFRWLSGLPRLIGSRTWGNWRHPRMMTWVRFRDLATAIEFVFVNTHWDHVSANARRKSAQAIRSLLVRRFAGVPAVVVGDFNVGTDSAPFATMTAGGLLRDAGAATTTRTYNDWAPPVDGERIDWILATGDFEVQDARTLTWTDNGRCPSDHWPVQAWLTRSSPAGG
ncbi:endonuclease/exonuclease/phosphatase family protein [Embleya sp. NBC_00896]|uniref:endonuclease/exonuclease/phosphatase family protein n=1 Tax=Embleya sp. NBC_00896 TaxID=2975961 RepID=UPI003866C502|nr:endonuclease/exonuclease/phosphatase family protein [Embleya sp. NBC_00896]